MNYKILAGFGAIAAFCCFVDAGAAMRPKSNIVRSSSNIVLPTSKTVQSSSSTGSYEVNKSEIGKKPLEKEDTKLEKQKDTVTESKRGRYRISDQRKRMQERRKKNKNRGYFYGSGGQNGTHDGKVEPRGENPQWDRGNWEKAPHIFHEEQIEKLNKRLTALEAKVATFESEKKKSR